MIRTFLFDLGNVLVHFSVERMCRQMAAVCNCSEKRVYDLLFDSGLLDKLEIGQISEDDAYREFTEALGAQVDREQLDLAACDIFAFPSHAEGMPNSPLEAMAMERPVVAFAIPPVEEIDGGKGVVALCPPFDVAAFAESIRRLAVGKEERLRRGAQGRAVVHDRFLVRRSMAAAAERLREEVRVRRGEAADLRSVASAGRAG